MKPIPTNFHLVQEMNFPNMASPEAQAQTAVVRIKNSENIEIVYSKIQELAYLVFDSLYSMGVEYEPASVTVEYQPDVVAVWDFTLAHYTFGEGRMTGSDFVKLVFGGKEGM